MGDRTQINLRVDSGRKTVWEKAATEAGSNLSQYIRACVESDIADTKSQAQGQAGNEVNQRLSELEETQEQVVASLDSLGDTLETIEKEVTRDDELQEIQGEAYEVLPGTPSTLAAQIDRPELRVRQALEKLAEDTNLVYSEPSELSGDESMFRRVD